MKYRLIVKEEAARETLESFLWYESQQQGLGNDFLLHIQESINLLRRSHLLFRKYLRNSGKCL
jgi:hypothetical protein